MYFTDALKVIARRWYVAAVGLVLVAAASVVAMKVVSTQYQASGQVVLLPPSAPVPEGGEINPYLGLPSALTMTASLVAASVSAPDVQRELAAEGYPSEYVATVVPQTGPLIAVTVNDTDPAAAVALRDRVLERIEAELDAIQGDESVANDQRINTRRFTVSSQAEVLAGSRLRAVAVIGALGMVLTLAAIFGLERIQGRRHGPATDPALPVDDGPDVPMVAQLRGVMGSSVPAPLPARRPSGDPGRLVSRRRHEPMGRGR
jgi:capsular polysaccharide biosynthesis protein